MIAFDLVCLVVLLELVMIVVNLWWLACVKVGLYTGLFLVGVVLDACLCLWFC